MKNLNAKPTTVKDAYENGKSSSNEGQNPYRNMGFEVSELNNAWYKGFANRKH